MDPNTQPNPSQPNNGTQQPPMDQITPSFAVMPKSPQVGEITPQPPVVSDIKPVAIDNSTGPGIWHKKSTYIVMAVLILLALGVAAYFLLAPNLNKNKTAATTSKLPKIFLQQYFKIEVCQSLDKCGDAADPDSDGLTNYDEFVEQTDPTAADTDGDGLSDGDETNVYLTSATDKFTDKRADALNGNYTDSVQIKSNYDPLTPGIKMTQVRLEQIEAASKQFGLHEPTPTTLTQASQPAANTVTVMIVNNKFDTQETTVKVGDTVVWLNKDSKPHQIMHGKHPMHVTIPGTEPILESGSLATNQTYSAVFTKIGTYEYHDELNPTVTGTIIVTE